MLRSMQRRVAASLLSYPRTLFADGGEGAWYDPTDKTTLFQDGAGTTPVTADGDTVGMMQDKSGNGNHLMQSDSALQPVFRDVNGVRWLDFGGAASTRMVVSSWPFAQFPFVAICATVDGEPVSFSHIVETRGNTSLDPQQRQPLIVYREGANDLTVSFSGQNDADVISLGDRLCLQAWTDGNGDIGYNLNGNESLKSATVSLQDGGSDNRMFLGSSSAGTQWDGKFYGMIRLARNATQAEREAIRIWLMGR